MLYGQKYFFHTKKTSIQHMENLSICCMGKLSICYIDKIMSDYTQQFHNEFIDMNYLRKIFMNVAPIRHHFLFSEWQNLPYSVLLGFIFPWNIFITTQCSGWGSSSVFVKSPKSDHSHQNNDLPQSILYLFIKKHILSHRPASAKNFTSYCGPTKASLIPLISLINQ